MVSRTTRRQLLAAALPLAGCAQAPHSLRLAWARDETDRLWPAPQSAELPRYRYLGELVGERNFSDGQPSLAERALAWIAGLEDGGSRAARRSLQRPAAVWVDAAGRILVADAGRAAVFVFDESAGRLHLWEQAQARQRFASPVSLCPGPGGSVLVSDALLGRVCQLDADGRPLASWGHGLLQRPTGLARDAAGRRVFVADTPAHDIKVFDDEGRLIDRWGARGGAAGELNSPTHLHWSGEQLWVSDALNARIQAFDPEGSPALQFGQRGLYIGNLVRPKGLASDDEGNLYVVESLHDTLLVFDRRGRLLLSIGGTGQGPGRFYLPSGVWVDARGRVFVADMFNARVAVYQFLGGL